MAGDRLDDDSTMEDPRRVLSIPEKGRDEGAAQVRVDELMNRNVVRTRNQLDESAGIPEILERHRLNPETSLMNMLM